MSIKKIHIWTLFKRTFAITVLSTGIINISISNAYALTNKYCKTPDQSASCKIAYEKIKTMQNPFNGIGFFDDKLHFWGDGNLVLNPTYYIAEQDINHDGSNEIIAGVPEADPHVDESHKRLFCQTLPQYDADQCPHFIFEYRQKGESKTALDNIHAFGPYYYYAIGVVTDNRTTGFKNLHGYKDHTWEYYDVLEYDEEADDYYLISSTDKEDKK